MIYQSRWVRRMVRKSKAKYLTHDMTRGREEIQTVNTCQCSFPCESMCQFLLAKASGRINRSLKNDALG
jgi:hypothetical protein